MLINGSSNNNDNSITARSYGDKSGRGQKKTLKADDRSDYLDLVKKLPLELSRSECLNSRVDIRQATFTSHSAAHHQIIKQLSLTLISSFIGPTSPLTFSLSSSLKPSTISS